MDGEGARGGRQVAAVAAPVHERLVDGHLSVKVVDIVVGHAGLGQDHALGGGRGGPAHAVDVGGVRVGAADDAQEELVAGCAGLLASGGQVLQAEENAFAGAATEVGGGDFDLGGVGHGASFNATVGSAPP